MYQTHGDLPVETLAVFSAHDGYSSSHMKPECAWRDSTGTVRVGTWLGEWQKIERAWALDTWGNWQGAPPAFLQAYELVALNENGTPATQTRDATDPVFHVGSGEKFQLDWLLRTPSHFEGKRNGSGAQLSIYDASDGSVVRTASSPNLPLKQDTLPDGSYCVYVQYHGVQQGLRLPTGYTRDPRFDYLTADERLSHYNPHLFVGEIPADAQHPLNVLRRELIASNEQEDNPDYSPFVTSESAQNGEGSAIKLQIGGGEWALGAGAFVTPSRALHELDFGAPEVLPEGTSPASLVPVSFDPLASVVSFVLHTRTDGPWGGKVLLGGGRYSGYGARPSLWQWNEDGTATLLGTAPQACDPWCEELLSTGLVTGLAELEDGSIILLTLCSRHKYNTLGAHPEDRMPRWPAETDGEPGGRSLIPLGAGTGSRVVHNTETFGQQPDPATPSFYNVMIDVLGDELVYAPGTIAHVDGALWRHRGNVFGVRADGSPTNENTHCYIAYYDSLWSENNTKWRARWMTLQRGVSVNGLNLAFGWVPGSETARAVRDDGVRAKVLEMDYRVRAATVTRNKTSPYYKSAIMPARKVIEADGNIPQRLSEAWHLIETDGGLNLEEVPPIIYDPLEPIGGEGDNRKWRVIELPARDGLVYAVQLRDVMDGTPFFYANANLDEKRIGVRLRVDSDADLDEIESYVWRVQMDRLIVLPIEAHRKVEMLIVTEPDLSPELLPIIGAV